MATEFALAEKLGMTVARLREEIGSGEFEQWKVFWGWRRQIEELELASKVNGG